MRDPHAVSWRAGECIAEVNDTERALEPLLAKAGILMFEYDVDGFLLNASGSCLGGSDPAMEVHAGLVTPSVVRRAAHGELVIDHVRVAEHTISVRHEPVRGEDGRTVKILATACDVTERVSGSAVSLTGLSAAF